MAHASVKRKARGLKETSDDLRRSDPLRRRRRRRDLDGQTILVSELPSTYLKDMLCIMHAFPAYMSIVFGWTDGERSAALSDLCSALGVDASSVAAEAAKRWIHLPVVPL